MQDFFSTEVIISFEIQLTRVNQDRNIFSINVKLTSTFFTQQRFGPSPSPNFISCTRHGDLYFIEQKYRLKDSYVIFDINLVF